MPSPPSCMSRASPAPSGAAAAEAATSESSEPFQPSAAAAEAATSESSESFEPSAAATEPAGREARREAATGEAARIAPGAGVERPVSRAAARLAAEPEEEHQEEQHEEQDDPARDLPLVHVGRRRDALPPVDDALRDRRHTALESLPDAPGTERRHDVAVLDRADQAVRQDALDAVAGQDAQLPVVRGDQDEHAGVVALTPDLPRVRDPHRVAEVVQRLGAGHGEDGDLGAGLLLERSDRLLHPRSAVRRDHAGQVGDESLRLGAGGLDRVRRGRERHYAQEASKEARATHGGCRARRRSAPLPRGTRGSRAGARAGRAWYDPHDGRADGPSTAGARAPPGPSSARRGSTSPPRDPGAAAGGGGR